MSELKITFTLSEKDVAHLRRLIRKATRAAAGEDDSAILGAAERLAKQVRDAQPPSYVLERVEKLEALVQMVQDEDYAILPAIRKKVLGALAYFAAPADLIPDPENSTLRVRFHGMANERSNRALRGLCGILNTYEAHYPGTRLSLILEAPPSIH